MTDLGPRGVMHSDRKQDAPVRFVLIKFKYLKKKYTYVNNIFSLLSLQHANFRKIFLGIYIVILVLFVIALVLIAVLAPIESSFKSAQSSIMN